MITDRMMWPYEKLFEDSTKTAKDLGMRDENAIAHFVIGALAVNMKALQEHIKSVEAAVKKEHKWLKEKHEEDDKEFLAGYKHALNIISTSLGIDL